MKNPEWDGYKWTGQEGRKMAFFEVQWLFQNSARSDGKWSSCQSYVTLEGEHTGDNILTKKYS